MTETTYTSAELGRAIVRIEEGQKRLEGKLDDLSERFVLKEAYDIRNIALDREIADMKKSIATQAADSKPTKTSGWTIAGVIISALVGVGSLITVAVLLIKITANIP